MAVPQVSIKISGEELDIFDSREFPLSLDFQIEDLTDFTRRKGSGSSKTFKLPATVKNDKIFSLFGTYSGSTDNLKTFEDVEIFYDGIPISTGSAILRSVITQGDKFGRKAKEYEIAFLLENSDWFFKLSGKTLNELDFTDHDYTIANISGSYWNGDLSFSDYGYTLIKWKEFISESSGWIEYEDFTPFLYIADIIEKSFLSIGYTLDSNFLSSSFARRLIIPVPLRQYGDDYKKAFTDVRATSTNPIIFASPIVSGKVPIDDDSTPPNFDNGGNYNTGLYEYIVPQDGDYRFRTVFTLDNITSGGSAPYPFVIGVFINGVLDIPTLEGYSINNNENLEFDKIYTLTQGDTISIQIGAVNPVNGFRVLAGALLEVKAVLLPYVLNQSFIDFEYLAPKLSLNSLIAGVSELFDLFIFADSASRVVRIEPRKNFFDQKKDFTPFVDISRDGSKSFTSLSLSTIYQYQEDSNDDTVSFVQDNADLDILSAKYISSDPLATGSSTNTNTFFAPTLHIKLDTISGLDNTDTAPQIPIIYPANYIEDQSQTFTDFDFLPRILYHKGVTTFNATSTEPSPEGTISLLSKSPTTRSGYPKSFAVNYDDTTGTDPSLSYATETLFSGVTVPGLLETYFLDHLATLNNGVQRTEFIRFKITDILGLNFREKYFLYGIDHVLQKIDNYAPILGRSTKVILIEDICASQDDIDAIENTTVEDVIKL